MTLYEESLHSKHEPRYGHSVHDSRLRHLRHVRYRRLHLRQRQRVPFRALIAHPPSFELGFFLPQLSNRQQPSTVLTSRPKYQYKVSLVRKLNTNRNIQFLHANHQRTTS